MEKYELIGKSVSIKKVQKLIKRVAVHSIPVLISGETGTGKEIVAYTIHNKSSVSDGPFIPLHTGAISHELILSELFGHEKGAFTGADHLKQGQFELADGGTLFLDEISTMEERTQIILLRVLETKTFLRVGGTKPVKTNVRIIAATNENLKDAIKRKLFRKDLFYRISTFSIRIPPLRKRKKDIVILIHEFIQRYTVEFDKKIETVSREAMRLLISYSWPGNVRELENVLMRAVIMTDSSSIEPDVLPEEIKMHKFNKKTATPDTNISTLDKMERNMLVEKLAKTNGNREETAKILGISRKGLYNKIKKYKLDE
ncbi:MAG: sigma-54 dependent transcriptional regulator [Spirochaetia bacterium]|jgi:DNA-binding NtrC family response regulator|nr:sigma-54 dependent transcriptional regulator [Spirochaetia bacterium]